LNVEELLKKSQDALRKTHEQMVILLGKDGRTGTLQDISSIAVYLVDEIAQVETEKAKRKL